MAEKTNTGLVGYVKSKLGTPYVYGAKMEVLTKAKYDMLKGMYGSMVWDSDVKKVGQVCCDCSGLISAYTGIMRGSAQYRDAAAKAGKINPISTVSAAPIGALVWKDGHIGVYVGLENGVPMYIAEDGSASGCRKGKLPGVFTHWFLCVDISYETAMGIPGEPAKPVIGNPITETQPATPTTSTILAAMDARKIIYDKPYWQSVLEGKQAPREDYLRTVFGRLLGIEG